MHVKPSVITTPLQPRSDFGLSSMQGGYEDDFIVILQDVFTLPFQLPISVIYKDKDARSPAGFIGYIDGK